MTEEKRVLIKAVSLLLRYPDVGLRELLDGVEEVLAGISESRAAELVRKAVSRLGEWPLLKLQEEYTRVFDLNAATSLHLTYHKYGDGKERGQALARFASLYKTAGLMPRGHDLPDYLPLVLEFVSVSQGEGLRGILGEIQGEVDGLTSRLKASGSVYAGLFEALSETMDMTVDETGLLDGRTTP